MPSFKKQKNVISNDQYSASHKSLDEISHSNETRYIILNELMLCFGKERIINFQSLFLYLQSKEKTMIVFNSSHKRRKQL